MARGRRMGARSRALAKVPRPLAAPSQSSVGPTLAIKRSEYPGALSFSATDKGWLWDFAITDLPSYTEFLNLFQYFRFRSITLKFRLAARSSATDSCPVLYAARAHSGSGTPAAITDVLQLPHRVHVFNEAHPTFTYPLRTPIPGVQPDACIFPRDSGGVWTPTSSAGASTAFKGLAGWIVNGNTTVAPSLTLEAEYVVEFAGAM